jgi:Beta-lactamase/Domain of unknown function (DUF3471)
MSSTSSSYADFISEANRARLHVPTPPRNPDPQSPAGGVTSSAKDLAQWLRLKLGQGKYGNKQLINATDLLTTHQPIINRGSNVITSASGFYGLGWNIDYDPRDGRVYLSHAGAFSNGARSFVQIVAEEGLGVVALSNCFPTGVPEGIAYTFFDWVHFDNSSTDWVTEWDDIYNQLQASFTTVPPEFAQPPKTPTPAKADAAYAGRYHNDYVGLAEVMTGRVGLVLLLGPELNASFLLKHWNGNNFTFFPFSEDPTLPSGVRFQVGETGNVTGVTYD